MEYPPEPSPEAGPQESLSPPPRPPEPKPEIKIEPELPPEPPLQLEAITDGMEITADQLDTLYRSDSSGAHGRFGGKTLVVRGVVDKVFIREHLEIRYIMLRGTGRRQVWGIRCTFNKEDSLNLNRLHEGDAVVVRGRYDGYSKNIMFKDCRLL
jgi:hypothetical protein